MADKVRPIKPDEVTGVNERSLPDAVFESFNELIVKNWNDVSAVIKQKDVVALMVEKGLNRREISSNYWLDVENIYWAVGWIVFYDKPGYGETYPATFQFIKRSSKRS